MQKYNLVLDLSFPDGRVLELAKIAKEAGMSVGARAMPGKQNVYVFMSRQPKGEIAQGGIVYDFAKLQANENFVKENNALTAKAMLQIMGDIKGKSILIVGYGRLTKELEKALKGAIIYILNYNRAKCEIIDKKYGDRHFFESAPLQDFDVIINTVPKQVITAKDIKHITNKTIIYELASPPYGFDFGKGDPNKFNYKVEPGLPGRYFPSLAAKAIFSVIKGDIEKCKKNPLFLQ